MARKNPNFAIVKIPDSANVVRFYHLLVEHGFSEVSFVNEVRENAFLPQHVPELNTLPKAKSFKAVTPWPDIKAEIIDENAGKVVSDVGNTNCRTSINGNLFKRLSDSSNPSPSSLMPKVSPPRIGVKPPQSTSVLNESSGSDVFTSEKPGVVKRSGFLNSTTSNGCTIKNSNLESTSGLEILPNNKSIHHNTQKLMSVSPTSAHNLAITAPTFARVEKSSNSMFSGSSSGGNAGFLIAGPNTSIDEEGNVYAMCQLCRNRIMSSRLSNLTNHVRRHAAMKQYQCSHCAYSHNEMAKVRLHMNHNHKDFNSQPIDALCFEMQLQWSLLMEQCFPEHAKRSKDADVWKLASNSSNPVLASANTPMLKGVNINGTYTCAECGEMLVGSRLVEHLKDLHRGDCRPFGCSECGYQNAKQWKVRLHISIEHAERAVEARADQLPPGNWSLFLSRFFLDIPNEGEEERMIAQLCENSDIVKSDLASIEESFSQQPTNNNFWAGQSVTCVLCDKIKTFPCNPISNLLNHAKRHYVVKQFRCPECSHACSDNHSMRIHIKLKHGNEGIPTDLINDELKSAWIDTLKRCFPKLRSRVDEYKFEERDFICDIQFSNSKKCDENALKNLKTKPVVDEQNSFDNSQKQKVYENYDSKAVDFEIASSGFSNENNEDDDVFNALGTPHNSRSSSASSSIQSVFSEKTLIKKETNCMNVSSNPKRLLTTSKLESIQELKKVKLETAEDVSEISSEVLKPNEEMRRDEDLHSPLTQHQSSFLAQQTSAAIGKRGVVSNVLANNKNRNNSNLLTRNTTQRRRN